MVHEPAKEPNDLARLFVQRANAGDLDGVVALFEPDAIMTGPDGGQIAGHQAIRAKYAAVLARRPRFSLGNQQPAMIHGDIALTIPASTTAAPRPRWPGASRTAPGCG